MATIWFSPDHFDKPPSRDGFPKSKSSQGASQEEVDEVTRESLERQNLDTAGSTPFEIMKTNYRMEGPRGEQDDEGAQPREHERYDDGKFAAPK